MGSRLISWRGAASLVVVGALCGSGAACGGGARHDAAVEDPNALVIPALARDAGGAPAADAPAEPMAVRTALTIRARDPRIEQRQPRSRAHIVTEVQGLERLLATTHVSAPGRPTLQRRLAEAYDELARTASGPDAARARDEAIKSYVTLKVEHAEYAQMDEVLYDLGLAYELNGDAANARRSYLELVANHPSSRLIPLAYFAFGELFVAEAEGDASKYELALQAYKEVFKRAPANHPITPDALLRVGETCRRTKDDATAKESFDRLRRDFPNSDAVARIPPGD